MSLIADLAVGSSSQSCYGIGAADDTWMNGTLKRSGKSQEISSRTHCFKIFYTVGGRMR